MAIALGFGPVAQAAAAGPADPPGQQDTTAVTPAPPPPGQAATEIASPSIAAPAGGSLVGDAVRFSGTAESDSQIQLIRAGSNEPLCTATVDAGGSWSCSVHLPSGPASTVRAVQLVPGHDDLETETTIDVLNAPTAEAGGGGSNSNGTVMGTAFAGATVTATVGGVSCLATADGSGAWFCILPRGLSSGVYTLSATQSTPWSGGSSSAPSAPFSLTIDVDAPSAPGVSAVPEGSPLPLSGAVFSGTGEDEATITVFAGAYSLCQVMVTNGLWTCRAGAVAAGSYAVSAIQQDPAGNISPESPKVTLAFGRETSETPPPTSDSAPEQADPESAAPGLPDAGSPDAAAPGTPDETAPEAGPQPDAAARAPGGWSAATPFSSALQPVFGPAGATDWSAALAIGLAMIALLAVPARLLAGTLRGLRAPHAGSARSGMRFTGRNRAKDEFERAPSVSLNRRATGTVLLLAAAAVTVLSAPVEDQPAYLRLLGAVALGVVAVNAVAALIPAYLSRALLDQAVRIVLKPQYLLISVLATVLSRTLGLHPALLFGLVFGLSLAAGAGKAARGRVASIQIGVLTVLGASAWMVSGALPHSLGFVDSFAAEFVNTVSLAALGSAGILLLPFGRLGGRAIVRWRPLVWLTLAVTVFTLLGGLLATSLEGIGGGAGIILLGLASLAFAALCLSLWMWARFIRPALDPPE